MGRGPGPAIGAHAVNQLNLRGPLPDPLPTGEGGPSVRPRCSPYCVTLAQAAIRGLLARLRARQVAERSVG
jgi:hypothetical protein